jgi:phosphatidylglycerophosphate synthase
VGDLAESAAPSKVFFQTQPRVAGELSIGGDSKMLNNRPSTQTIPNLGSSKTKFREAKRIQQSFLANAEKRTLIWLAARTPAWINSDHLTLLGLLSMAAAGAAYWWSATNRLGLILVILCLALNWLGDSLDGTLARFRDHSRPRYGFYVDHIVDAFSAFFLLGGLALSSYMSPAVALGLLIAYLMLSVEIYLATYAVGDFKISYYKMGPTELRILLSIGNLAVLWKSTVHLLGRAHRLFDVAGTLGISGMLLIMVISAVRNTMRLYREEPIPVGKPLPNSQETRLHFSAPPPRLPRESSL